jgi:hypothetical protein
MMSSFAMAGPRIAAACMVMLGVLGSACSSGPKAPSQGPMSPALRITNHVGGTHYRTIVRGDLWYQTFRSSLLTLNPREASVIKSLELGRSGEVGPAVDMLIDDRSNRMWIAIEDDEVVEVSLDVPYAPSMLRRISAAALGVRPRRLCALEGEIFVCGPGGIVRLGNLQRVYDSPYDPGRLAKCMHGVVTTVNGQVRRIADDRFVGSASALLELPAGSVTTRPGATSLTTTDVERPEFVFTSQGVEGAMVGFMTDDLLEPAGTGAGARIAVRGDVHSLRFAGDRLWVVSDDAVTGYDLADRSFRETLRVDVIGARVVDDIGANEIAVAGSAGRAVYKIAADADGPGGTLVRSHREAGHLPAAVADAQHVLAGGPEGMWMYLIGSRVELTRRTFERPPPPATRTASIVSATAQISTDGRSLLITGDAVVEFKLRMARWTGNDEVQTADDRSFTYVEPGGSMIRCIAAVDGDFWLGHDRGITVIRVSDVPAIIGPSKVGQAGKGRATPVVASARGSTSLITQLRLPGPVTHLYPLMIGGGASFVSEYGGMGVARWVNEPGPN